MPSSLGRVLVLLGVALVVLGTIVWSGALRWLGRLPGDIRIERDTVHVYIPLVSMLLCSVLLSAILYIIRRF
jgi:hypothetical protein